MYPTLQEMPTFAEPGYWGRKSFKMLLLSCSKNIAKSCGETDALLSPTLSTKNLENVLRRIPASVLTAVLKAVCALFIVHEYLAPRTALSATSRCSPRTNRVQVNGPDAHERAHQAGWFHNFGWTEYATGRYVPPDPIDERRAVDLIRYCCLLNSDLVARYRDLVIISKLYGAPHWLDRTVSSLTNQSCGRTSGQEGQQLFLTIYSQKLEVFYCLEHFAVRSWQNQLFPRRCEQK